MGALTGTLLYVLLALLVPAQAQLSTDDHLADPGFWPTQAGASRSEYVGSSQCADCHSAKATSQHTTPMANTAILAEDSSILRTHPLMKFDVGAYHYEIKTSDRGNIYSVTDGKQTSTATLLWAFGTGKVGQSYLFKKNDGNFYEARVTYFATLQNIHFTPGRALTSPRNLDEAMYRQVDAAEIKRCFACHTTAAVIGDAFDEKKLMPGVTCEACHGAGAKHVAAAEAAKMAGLSDAGRGSIYNPALLNPLDSVDFCGACHGTFWDVKLSGAKGVTTVKSQPYRLERSKCWNKGDSRLTCVACHNPHEQVQTEPSAYDAVCLTCHAAASVEKMSASPPGKSCPVQTKNCVSCHMPKVYVPEMHTKFTDHRIRIVRKDEAFPE